MNITDDFARLMWLEALERAGVDGWEGVEEARKEYKALVTECLEEIELKLKELK